MYQSLPAYDQLVVLNETCPKTLSDEMGSGWVNIMFGVCIVNMRQWFAFCIGLTSLLIWFVAIIPQLIKNCHTGNADQALSFLFLLQMLIGNLVNLVGAIVIDHLFLQIAAIAYFVVIDIVLLAQFIFYVVRNQGVKGLVSWFPIGMTRSDQTLTVLLSGMALVLLIASHGPRMLTRQDPYQLRARVGRTLMTDGSDSFVEVHHQSHLMGYIFGCISEIFYVFARIPQIIKNVKRRSVEGLSLMLFILFLLGNITYWLGILLFSVEHIFLLQKLPWLVGSVASFLLDFTIIMQFLIFSLKDKTNKIET